MVVEIIHIKKSFFSIMLLALFYPAIIKGQIEHSLAKNSSMVTMGKIYVKDAQIEPLLDNIVVAWDTSTLSNTYSYAIVIPHITYDKQILWRVRIEQLYDFEQFFCTFAEEPFFAKRFISYGVLQYKNRNIFVGVEKDFNDKSVEENSRDVVSALFSIGTDSVLYYRDNIEKRIETSSFIYHTDSIGGTGGFFDWELFIEDKYDALLLEFMEMNNQYVCLKKTIAQAP